MDAWRPTLRYCMQTEVHVYALAVAASVLLSFYPFLNPRKAQIVELRYFGGMTVEETSEALGVHPNTVLRDWSLAKGWLKRELRPKGANAT